MIMDSQSAGVVGPWTPVHSLAWFYIGYKAYRHVEYGTVHCGMEQRNVGPWDIFPLELQEQHGGLDVSKQEAWADGLGPG